MCRSCTSLPELDVYKRQAHGRDAQQFLLIRLVTGILDRFGDCGLIGVLPVGAALDHFESCELRPGQGFLPVSYTHLNWQDG